MKSKNSSGAPNSINKVNTSSNVFSTSIFALSIFILSREGFYYNRKMIGDAGVKKMAGVIPLEIDAIPFCDFLTRRREIPFAIRVPSFRQSP